MPLFLFTGEEYTLLLQELTKRKTSFLEKYGEYGLFDFSSENLQGDQLQNALMSGGMFATKKLVIMRWVPLDSTAHNKAKTADVERCCKLLEQFLATHDTETIVVCVSYKPDKRTKPYKRFATNAQVKEFPPLDEKQKLHYVQQQFWSLLNSEQQLHLVTSCNDLWHLSNECNKIKHYANYHHLNTLTDDQLQNIVRSSISSNNFALLDHLYTNTTKSITLITTAQQAGEDTFQFLGMLYRWIKITINIINLAEQWITDGKLVASTLKAHPFVVSKQLKLLPQLKEKKQAVYTLYNDIIELDYQIKSWILPAEGFWLAVKQALLRLGTWKN